MKNKQLVALIKKHGGKTLKFKDLQKVAKYAMAYYMSIDGEAWDYPEEIEYVSANYDNDTHLMKKNIGFYTKKYGNRKFGFVNIPTEEFLDLFGELRKRYDNAEVIQERTEFWPVILDLDDWDKKSDPNDVTIIQDGWNRFYDYCAMGLKKIPCLYYVR